MREIIDAANSLMGEPVFNATVARRFTRWRHAIYAVARQDAGKSTLMIARHIAKCHTTVVYGSNRADPLLVKRLRARIKALRGKP